MKIINLIAGITLASVLTVSGTAIAADSTFQADFVNKTLLGNWKAQTVSSNDQIRNVDASKDRFMDNILGKFKIITPEKKVSQLNANDSLKSYTDQFERRI